MSFMDQSMFVDHDIRGSETQRLRGNLKVLVATTLLYYDIN